MHLLNVKTKVLAVDFRPKNPITNRVASHLKFTIYINLNTGLFQETVRVVRKTAKLKNPVIFRFTGFSV